MRRWILATALLFLASPVLSQSVEFFPLEDLREGMRGVGRTVFSGTTIEEFDVEILGILRNYAPRQDVVLARLAGGPLAETGVLEGMSGSPVYVDGRLVGAIAFTFDAATEPIAGIQPIGQMVSVLGSPGPAGVASGSLPAESVAAFVQRARTSSGEGSALLPLGTGNRLARGARSVAGMQPITTPLFMSGVSSEAIAGLAVSFEAFGFNPVQGAGTAPSVLAGPEQVVPGASINAEMVRGDISVTANGTVTYVDGDRVYAFGHPFQSTGPADFPMSLGEVLTLVPTRGVSFKVAVPTALVGRFTEDRATGVLGQVGELPDMIPVRVDVETSRSDIERYAFEIVNDPFMTPLMVNLTLYELILATERSLGDLTLDVDGEVRLESGDTVEVHASYAGETSSQAQVATATSAPITYLLSTGLDELAIESIELHLRSTDARRLARIEAIRVGNSEVRAGETVVLEAILRRPDGSRVVQEISLEVPIGLEPGSLELVVGDGVSVTGTDLARVPTGPPLSAAQIIRDLNHLRRMDRLYVRMLSSGRGAVIGGEEMPSLPPSMLAMLGSGRSTDSTITRTGDSLVGEFELGPSDYVIQGRQSLELAVVP